MKQLVSSALLKRQKTALWFLMVFFILLGIINVGIGIERGNYVNLFFILPLCLILPLMIYKDLKRIKSISYDDTMLYYRSRSREPLKSVPFDNIRSITIGNFTASFRINLHTPSEDGVHIYFKFPNIWNPFATKKRLMDIYELRDKIDACKSSMDEDYEGKTRVVRLAEI